MDRQQQAAEFFARLANLEALTYLLDEERDSLVNELSRLMPELGERLRSQLPKENRLSLGFDISVERRALEIWLEVTHQVGRKQILTLLDGETITVPDPGERMWHLKDRKVAELYKPREEQQRLYPLLIETLQHEPFPFGRCARCRRVFVQPGRGKPRRYCSESCKVRGIPSASKRTEYKRLQRQRAREREIATAQRIIRKVSSAQKQLELLGKEFPQKTPRQRRRLLEKANHT